MKGWIKLVWNINGKKYCWPKSWKFSKTKRPIVYKYKITALNEKGETIQSPVTPLNHPVELITEGQE